MSIAQAGDDVLLAAGTYTWTEQASTGSRMIIMKSGVRLHSESGPELTTIDAEGKGGVIYCNGVNNQTTIEGLTITGGNTDFDTGAGGAGIVCQNSSPRIENNIITGNYNGNGWYREGGGISCYSNSSPSILDNVITSNGSCSGGGISYTNSSGAVIQGNRISSNTTWSFELDWATYGGAIYCENADVDISDNVISMNGATYGGGVYFSGTSVTIENNLFKGNRSADGAAVMCGHGSRSIWFNTIVDHEIYPLYGTIDGSAVSFMYNENTYISGNIIAGTKFGSALSCGSGAVGYLYCNDLWSNDEGDGDCDTSHPSNISEDPLFCDPEADDYHLQEGSPCIGSGVFPCLGNIGAFGVGCSSVPVQKMTWGRVKAIFR